MIVICPKERLHELLPMAKRFFESSGEPGVFNPVSFLQFWYSMYDQDAGLILVSEKNQLFTGGIGVILYTEFLTGDLVALETFWYSEDRGGLAALNEAFTMAKNAGAKRIYIQHHNTEESLPLKKYYEKKGAELKYFRYIKEL